jgi:hypothetical protein
MLNLKFVDEGKAVFNYASMWMAYAITAVGVVISQLPSLEPLLPAGLFATLSALSNQALGWLMTASGVGVVLARIFTSITDAIPKDKA